MQGKKASALSNSLEYLGLKPAPCITYSSFFIASTFRTPVFPQASMHSFKVRYIMLIAFFVFFRFSGIGLLQILFKNPCPWEREKNEKNRYPGLSDLWAVWSVAFSAHDLPGMGLGGWWRCVPSKGVAVIHILPLFFDIL